MLISATIGFVLFPICNILSSRHQYLGFSSFYKGALAREYYGKELLEEYAYLGVLSRRSAYKFVDGSHHRSLKISTREKGLM